MESSTSSHRGALENSFSQELQQLLQEILVEQQLQLNKDLFEIQSDKWDTIRNEFESMRGTTSGLNSQPNEYVMLFWIVM